jgi:hypothetical protein
MKLWFASNENIHTIEVVFQIETTKADLQHVQYEANKAVEKQKSITAAIQVLKRNLKFLKTEAEIVSINQYKKTIYQLSGLYQEQLSILYDISEYKKEINFLLEKIQMLEFKKEQVKFRLLEFKKNE